jgi:hypothetical protein
LQQFVARKTDELGLNAVDGGSAAAAPTALPEQRRLNTALDKIAGTPDADVPRNIVDTMQEDGASLDDIIAELRKQAGFARGEGGFATPSDANDRALSRALDAQANLLSAQRRQAAEFNEEAAKIPEIVGVNAYELVRTRGRALAMGRRLNAQGLNEEARIANPKWPMQCWQI